MEFFMDANGFNEHKLFIMSKLEDQDSNIHENRDELKELREAVSAMKVQIGKLQTKAAMIGGVIGSVPGMLHIFLSV
jgi:peptidoglycan hydrolase CwlO-like protein